MKTVALAHSRSLLLAIILMLPGSLLAQSYYNMALGDYTENFASITNTNVWVTPTTGSWQGLAVNATGTVPSATRITTQSTNFTSGSSGGVQRGTNIPSSQNLQLLSTGSTDNTSSTAIDLLLNFTGRTAGTVSFDAATVFNSTGDRVGTLRVYYTTNNSTWSEITGGGLPYVATNNITGSGAVSVTLPSAINEASTAKLRFYYNNGTGGTGGSRPKISIDNVLVTSTPAVAGAPVITSSTNASVVAYVTTANIYQITASNSPQTYGATGLPAGLSIDTASGIISGTATVPGVYSVGITATNAQGTGGATLTLTVTKNPGAPTITSALTATGLVGTAFTYQILADNTPTTYSSGTLPAGLSLDSSTGAITGTPTAGGTFNVSITAGNALGSDTKTLVITVNSPPIITSPTSGSLYVTNNFSYTIAGAFDPTIFGASNLPTGWSLNTATGAITNGTTPLTTGTVSFGISATNPYGSASTNYTLKVFDQAMQNAVPLNVVVNKYVNSAVDKVQLLVVGDGTAGSTVDMRGMIIKDFSSSMASDGGGKFIFADNAVWAAVPAGTLIALSAGTTQTQDIDPADFYLAVNLGDTTYFTGGGGSFDIATTDMLMIKQAGSGVSGVAGGIHALAGGTAGAWFNEFTGAKLRATGTSGTDLGIIANNTTSQLSDYGASGASAATDATGGQAAAGLNFASWNNVFNEAYIKLLRGIIDGGGTATIANGDSVSPFNGQNVFDRNQTGQTVTIAYNPPSATTAVTALTVSVPAEMGTPLSANISVSGAGTAGASVGVAGQLVTISGLNALNPNTVTISLSGLVTPDTAASVTNSGRYAFAMQSQGSGGSLASLASSPSAVVIIPIANARNANASFVPTLLGQTVAVEGVASVGQLGSGTLNSALQDATHGITIFSSTVSSTPTRGNRFVVSGAVSQFNGLVQLNITNAALIFDRGPDTDPVPVTVTVSQFNASTGATNGITLQSRVVRIENLTYVSGTWAPNQTVLLKDAGDNQLSVRIQANATVFSAPTYPVTLTGIAGQFDNSSPFDTGFQIQPRDQADVPVLPPTITSALIASATINQAFSYQITATTNPPANSYDASPLPVGLSIDANTGLISGTPQESGTFNVLISATNGGGTDSKTLVLTVSSQTPYQAWAQGAPLNSTNQLKYAIGGATSPTATNGVAPTTTVTSSNLSITAIVRTNDPNLSVFGQAVTDLTTGPWSTNNVTMQPGDQTGVGEGLQRQIWSTPRNSDPKKFLRLQTTLSNQ